MTFLPGNQLGKLNKGHPDYLSAEQRKANGPKISAAKKGKPLTAVQRASLQRYWASKKGTSTHAPYGRVIACLTCGTLRYKYPRVVVNVVTNTKIAELPVLARRP